MHHTVASWISWSCMTRFTLDKGQKLNSILFPYLSRFSGISHSFWLIWLDDNSWWSFIPASCGWWVTFFHLFHRRIIRKNTTHAPGLLGSNKRHILFSVAGLWGLLALRLADDSILPFNYSSYAIQLQVSMLLCTLLLWTGFYVYIELI